MIPIRPTVSWRHRIAAAFTQRLALKASSVLLAVVLWFVVSAREPREEYAPVRFVPQLDSALVLRDPPPPIRAHVMGRPNEILKLAASPLVLRRQIANDVPDTLVLALRASDIEVPDGAEVIVREVYPQALTLRFEPSTARRVPVRSAIAPRTPGGTIIPAFVIFEPESVTVLGPRRAVALISFVQTVRETVDVDTLTHLIDLDTIGLGASVRPSQVKARFVRGRL